MSTLKLTADSGGGTVSIKAPASTTSNSAFELTLPGTGNRGLGKILQVQQTAKTDTASTTSTSYVDTGLSVSITPTSTSSKILVLYNVIGSADIANSGVQFRLLRGSTSVYTNDSGDKTFQGSSVNAFGYVGFAGQFLDSPSTTSATTYKFQFLNSAGTTSYINRSQNGTQLSPSSITVMEVAA